MIRRMLKLELAGLRKDLREVVKELQDLGTLHIEEPEALREKTFDFVKPVSLEPEELSEKQFLEQAESLLKEAVALLGFPGSSAEAHPPDLADPAAVLSFVQERLEKLRAFHKETEALKENAALGEKYRHILELLIPLVKSREPGWREVAIGISKDEVKAFERALRKATQREFPSNFGKPQGDEVLGVVCVSDRFVDVARQTAFRHGAYEVTLPEEFRGRPLQECLAELDRRLADYPQQLEELTARMRAYAEAHGPSLLELSRTVREHVDRFRVLANVIETRYTFYLTAWTPQEQHAKVASHLDEKFAGRVSVRELGREEWCEEEDIPVELKNPRWLKPFELLVKVFPPPVYGTLDATFLVALFFPVFFGIILGDIGYGVILLALSLGARFKWKAHEVARRVSTLGAICAFSTIFFGFVFGEIFGTLGHGWLKPLWADRLFVMTEYLLLSIGIGIFHIVLGLVLGIFLAIRHGSLRHALEKLGFLVFTVGCILAVLGLVSSRAAPIPILAAVAPTRLLWSGLGAIALSFLLIVIGAGPLMLIEVFSIVSNIMSYARIMAIGIASVSLAKVANDLGSSTGGFLGLTVALTLHAINMVLGIFDPTVQSLRLHYVEFFTKFYQPGGRAFEPFRKH